MIQRRMPLLLPPFEDRLSKAVAHYWRTLDAQKGKQKAGTDHGNRSAVTGGKQMDGFCSLVEWLLLQNGLGEASIYVRSRREIPGYFRPTKDWDMIVVHEGRIVAALEFTSQRLTPFADEFNARIEDTIGKAADMWAAFREGDFGMSRPRPWLGWVMLFEDRTVSKCPASSAQPPVEAFPEFSTGSYSRRYEQLLHKFAHERLFDAAAFLASPGKSGANGVFIEPAADLTMKRLLASLAGYVGGYLAEARSRPCGSGELLSLSSRKRPATASRTRPATVTA